MAKLEPSSVEMRDEAISLGAGPLMALRLIPSSSTGPLYFPIPGGHVM